MDRRFELRKQEMLAECEVVPEVFKGSRNACISSFSRSLIC